MSAGTISFLVTSACQNRCVFCFQRGSARSATLDVDFLLAKVAERRPRSVDLAGGEPLLHPGMRGLLERLSASGIRVTLTTNGLALADRDLARFVADRVARLVLSVHGATSQDYAATTGNAEGFRRLETAIRNLEQVARPGQVLVNTTVTRWTWERAEGIPGLVAGLRPAAWHVTNPMPLGAAASAYGQIAPRLARVRSRVEIVAEAARERGIPVFFGYFPSCGLGRYRDANTDLLEPAQARGFRVDQELNPHQVRDLTFERVYPEACSACVLQGKACAGVAARYVELFGDSELLPVTAVQEGRD